MVRALELASHQCGQGSIPGLRVKCGFEFVVGSRPCSDGFSPGSPVFSVPSTKTNTFKFQFDPERTNTME